MMLREITRNRPPRHRRLYREPLETRRLLVADITVDTLVDEADGSIVDGDISLRDALDAAAAGDTIDFSVSGTITLTLGELVIDRAVTIDGPGPDMLTIDASGNDPTPASVLDDIDNADDGDGSRVFNVDDGSGASVSVNIDGLTLTGGDVSGAGGAIYSAENLGLSDTVVSGNNAVGAGTGGGGIHARRDLTITDSTVIGNTISGSNSEGGGVYANAALTLLGSNISGNRTLDNMSEGGGIYANGVTNVTDSTVTDNSTSGQSSAGGGIFTFADLNIFSSAVSGNITAGDDSGGGGVYTKSSSSDITLSGSTLSGNSTLGSDSPGGGMYNVLADSLTIFQSTISGNTTAGADSDGGGISGFTDYFDPKTITIQHSTITDNHTLNASSDGGGIREFVASNATIAHSIIAGNTDASGNHPDLDLASSTLNVEFSLIGDNQGTSLAEAQTPDGDGNLIGSAAGSGVIDPLLDALADNGGPTLPDGNVLMTHALLVGSPALEGGDPSAMAGVGSVPEFDQRGTGFSRVVGDVIDIGAFESPPLDMTPPTVTVDELLTNDNTPELTGTVDDPTATITIDVGGQIGVVAINNGDGTWTLPDGALAALADDTYDVVATATDAAMNAGMDETTDELTVDTTAPVVTVDELLTNDDTPELTGTIDDPTATITIDVGGQIGLAATNNGNGTWTLPDDTLAALADGTYDVIATATDQATNVGVDTTVDEVTVDTNVSSLPGDGNHDGKVNGLDYIIWASNFGQDPAPDPPGAPDNGDYNFDGAVNGLDYIVWATNFGTSNEALPGDGNLDGAVNGLDYIIWASNFPADPAPDPPGSPENGDYNDDGAVNGLDYIVWASNFGTSVSAASAVGPTAHDAVLESEDDGDAVLQFSLDDDGDDPSSVMEAVDQVLESLE